MKKEIDVRTMTDDELDDMMTNVIDEREGTRDGTKKAERLDDLYYRVDAEIQRRKRRDEHARWRERPLTSFKTGIRIPYKNTGIELVEWKCPTCCHRWWEYSDATEYPESCPLCGLTLE